MGELLYMKNILLINIYFTLLFSQIVINELMVAPINDLGGQFSEYIELYNTSDEDINLENWSIQNEFPATITFPSIVISAHSYFTIGMTNNTGLNQGMAFDYEWGVGNEFLDNAFDGLVNLYDNNGNLIDTVLYDIANWPLNDAMSMELNNPFNDNSIPVNWTAGTTPYDNLGVNMGSPGLENSNYTSVPSLSYSNLDFGVTQFGTPTTLPLTLTSSGGSPVTIFSISDNSEQSLVYAYDIDYPEFPITLQPEESYDINITFNPDSPNHYHQLDLTFATDALPDNSFSILLSGEAGTPEISIAQDISIDNTNVLDSDTFSVYFENTGSYTLNLINANIQGNNGYENDFEIISTFPILIEPGESSPIDVIFSPSESYNYSMTLEVEHDDIYYQSDSIYEYSFNAQGIAPLINWEVYAANSTEMNFPAIPADQEIELSLHLENNGTADLYLDFSFNTNYFEIEVESPFTIIPGENNNLSVTFIPDDSIAGLNEYEDILTISTNDPNMPLVEIPLSGMTVSSNWILVPGHNGLDLQGGIDTANQGDSILVDPGTYNGEIIMKSGITVMSKYILDQDTTYIHNTIINGVNSYRCVNFHEAENSTLNGFTIQNGHMFVTQNGYYSWGAGIRIEESNNVSLENLIVKDNKLNVPRVSSGHNHKGGVGAWVKNGNNLTLTNVSIINNEFNVRDTNYGGENYYCGGFGIYILDSDSVHFNNTNINGNYKEGPSDIVGDTERNGGGGVYLHNSFLTLDNSSVNNNKLTVDFSPAGMDNGGGIFMYNSSLISRNSQINNNEGYYSGAGIFLYNGSSENILHIENSEVNNNTSKVSTSGKGGGIMFRDGSDLDFTLLNSSVSYNTSGYNGGGGIYYGDSYSGNAYIEGSFIDNNTAGSLLYQGDAYGGGIYIKSQMSEYMHTIKNTSISGNTALKKGGGIYIYNNMTTTYEGITSFENCQINNNTLFTNSETDDGGAGVYAFIGNINHLNIKESEIMYNTTPGKGGAVWIGGGNNAISVFELNDSKIAYNYALNGSGIYSEHDNTSIQNNLIYKNNAVNKGGGLYLNVASSPIIFNNTIAYNTSNLVGSGIYINSTYPVIQNSILWANQSQDGAQINIQSGSELIISFSNIAGGLTGIIGFDDIIYLNNIQSDPEFIDSSNDDYNLLFTSSCIDAGNPNSPLDPDGTVTDMGALFFNQQLYIPGCMDEGAQNYESDANLDTGCIYGPSFISAYDVPNDQGGYTFINWQANSLDVLPNTLITNYSAWRFVPNQRGWEHLGDIPASYEDSYTFTAPTIETSIIDGDTLYTTFKVKAHTAEQDIFYESNEIGAYSIDNLSPSIPSGLMGSFNDGTINLEWEESLDPDLLYYELYKNNEFFDYVTSNTYVDFEVSIGSFEYYLIAYDENENISEASDILTITIESQHGDINMDGSVDIIDVVSLVNFILYSDNNDTSQFDVSGNGLVDIIDIIALINIILDN
ncbi:MAG: hypothetical protein CMG66_01260 [Candidatus Marinimicrobia bacterium]|nr:hypothetical protein [Candidatus Neomarinimicrobiota bacterium]|tara:strand:+ start:34364 stop:38764 length:4401 start_codon:yes stop_codon:yes gene_type:complete